MKFHLIDSVVEQSADRIVAIKQVSLAEEYLADHFPSFPILPGVLMIEAMVQAARQLLMDRTPRDRPLVLGEVKSLKFGNMVRPGEALVVEVSIHSANEDGSFSFKGTGRVRRTQEALNGEMATAVSGRFTMRLLQPA
jgi:3-hydroxyacyl-[acyl-carrier-protein] dehydratase